MITPAVTWWWSDEISCDSVGTVIKRIMIVVGYWYYKCGVKNKKEKKIKEKKRNININILNLWHIAYAIMLILYILI